MGSLLKGTVRSYDALNGTAEVEIYGSHGQYITVPVATHLDGSVVTDGKRCAILSFDEHNTGDAVLVATYNDVFGMGAGPLQDHDHTGDSGDGGQLEADEALLATEITDGYVLTADGAGGCAWEGIQTHGHGTGINTGGQLIPETALSAYGADEGDVLTVDGGAWVPVAPSGGGGGIETWGTDIDWNELNRDSTSYLDCSTIVTITTTQTCLIHANLTAEIGRDTSGNYVQVKLTRDGSDVGEAPQWNAAEWFDIDCDWFEQRDAGTYTYKIWVRRSTGSGAGSIRKRRLTVVAIPV